jgi:hypothetical protein
MSVRSFSRLPVLAAALLAAVVAPAGGPAQEKKMAPPAAVAVQRAMPEAQFDQWVFQQDQNAAGARKRLEAFLTLQVEEIDRACALTDAQKQKVQLTGRGDIARFFSRYEEMRQKFLRLNPDQERFMQEMWQEIRPLQMTLQTGLFQDDSLLFKSLHHTLTPEQLTRYETVARERRQLYHRANVELAVAMLEQTMPLRDAQRRGLIDLLVKETRPARKTGIYDFYVAVLRLGRMPEEKLKPLFDATQWKAVRRLVEQYRGVEPFLRQNGFMPDEDDEADRAEARPAAPKVRKE